MNDKQITASELPLGYEGNVIIRGVSKNSKKETIISTHNAGTSRLFRYLCGSLAGENVREGRPVSIDMFKFSGTVEDPSYASILICPIPLRENVVITPVSGSNNYAAIFVFSITSGAVKAGDKSAIITKLVLKDYSGEDCAEVELSDTEATSFANYSSVRIEWKLIIGNK